MAEGVSEKTLLNHGETMNHSGNALQQVSQEVEGKGLQVRRTTLPAQEEGNLRRRSGLKFHEGSLPHVQIANAIFEQEQAAVAIVDLYGRIRQANRAFAALLGYSQEELQGMFLKHLSSNPEHTNDLSAIYSYRNKDAPVEINHLVRKSGETVECLMNFYALRDKSGKTTQFLVFAVDARAQRHAEELQRLETELHRAQALQTLGLLAGGIAHDFNNVLEVILGFASLARIRLASSDPLHEPLKIIEESARSAATLAQQLLDVSTNNSTKEKITSAGEVVGAVLTIITRTFDRKIRIEHQIAPQLPCIRGLPNRLERAILNLCLNARDAMPQGGTLTLAVSSQNLEATDPRLPSGSAPGTYVRIAVRDSGVGIEPDVIDQIFAPFFTTKDRGHGSGIGLSIVDRIIREAHGFISVSSEPGRGSEFALSLPAVFTDRPQAAKPGLGQPISGRGTILVVDDEPRVLEFLEKGLTRLGYKVVATGSGTQACEIYSSQSDKIDCVLIDMIMPGLSGLETCARLREINPNVRAIISSGYSSGHVKRQAVETGSTEFLGKPYTLEELSIALRKIQQN